MSTKQRRPSLDRRNAIKNIVYDASTSTSSSFSSSFDDQSTHRTRSLDLSPLLTQRTSFRIEGIDGEFDRICHSLGFSGPEDFTIPVSDWEASKDRSPAGRFSASRLQTHYHSDKVETEELRDSRLAEAFEATISVSDELKKRGSDFSHLRGDLDLVKGEAPVKDDKYSQLNVLDNSLISVGGTKCGGCGIKGTRPPILAPPPAMSRFAVDDKSSTWDILKAFGPQDDKHFGSSNWGRDSFSPLNEKNSLPEGNEEVDRPIVGKQEPNGVKLRDTTILPEPSLDSPHDDNNDDSHGKATEPFSTVLPEPSLDSPHDDNNADSHGKATEPFFFTSPNGKFKCTIKSWQKGDFLGRGSFGTVYEGFTDDGFFFAVKEVSLLDQGIQAKQSLSHLQQEINLLSQFQHENIVRYLGTDKDDGKLYIFLELVTKGSLANLYQKYTLWDSQVSAYTRQILNGLKYLHSKDIVHRDIKCANILVDANGSVKLADFGLAKATTLNDVKSCKGTAFWMAPEVVNRKNHGYGLAADIWSLGCTVLEMLTRQVPYSHLEGMQALFRIGKGEPPPIPNSLSRDAQDFIVKCLQVKPHNRPSAAQLLDHPFVKKPLSSFSVPASPHHYVAKQ